MANSDEPVVVNAPVWLRFLVYIMGFVLVALFIFVLVAIFYKANTSVPVLAEPALIGVGLPPDAQFKDVSLNGDRLTVNTGKTIYVIDVPSHRIILRVDGKQD
jgi:hypothetical protein